MNLTTYYIQKKEAAYPSAVIAEISHLDLMYIQFFRLHCVDGFYLATTDQTFPSRIKTHKELVNDIFNMSSKSLEKFLGEEDSDIF